MRLALSRWLAVALVAGACAVAPKGGVPGATDAAAGQGASPASVDSSAAKSGATAVGAAAAHAAGSQVVEELAALEAPSAADPVAEEVANGGEAAAAAPIEAPPAAEAASELAQSSTRQTGSAGLQEEPRLGARAPVPAAYRLGAPEPELEPEPAAVASPARTGPQSEVHALLGEFYDACDNRDWSRAQDCFWPDATITEVRVRENSEDAEVVVLPAPDFFAELQRAEAGRSESFEGHLEVHELHMAGNVAQAWCRYAASIGGPEDVMEWHRYDAFNFVQDDGRWRIAALVQSLSIDSH